MKQKIAAVILCLVTLMLMTGTAGGKPGGLTDLPIVEEKMIKDETVYANLHSDGTLSDLEVVNRIETPVNGIYIDHGDYKEILNLTNSVKPVVTGDKISWRLNTNNKGFYYQGKLKDAQHQLPFSFDVTYSLNGLTTPAEEMAGKRGEVTIHIGVKPNPACAEYFRNNYFCQLQAPLSLEKCSDIVAPGASSIITGQEQSLGFMVMPNKTAAFEIKFQTDDFAFEGLTMTCMPFAVENMLDIDLGQIKDQIKEMNDGTGRLVDGTGKLKNGLEELSDGMTNLTNGSGNAATGLDEFNDGLKGYAGGVSELAAKSEQITENLHTLSLHGQDLDAGFAQLKEGIELVFTQTEPTAPPELKAQIVLLRGQLAAYEKGLAHFSAGVSDLASGMQTFTEGLKQLDRSGNQLLPGLEIILSGMGKLTDGLSQTGAEMEKLPNEVNKLLDGQIALKSGLEKAPDVFNEINPGTNADTAPISFVSAKNTPKTVQFIYQTAEIGMEKDTSKDRFPEEEKKGFWERLLDLFRDLP